MSSPSLSGLANELVDQIFRLLPNCHAVAALNSTSRRFYHIWLSNAASISTAVLSRTIDCYGDAEELVRLQTAQEQDAEAEDSETENLETNETDDAYQKVLKRNKRFGANASMVILECTELRVEATGEFYQYLEGPDPEKFRHAHFLYLTHLRYRIHSIVALSHDPAAQDDYLEATSWEDLKNMQHGRIWVNPRHYYTDFDYFRIYLKTRSARDPFGLVEKVERKMTRGR